MGAFGFGCRRGGRRRGVIVAPLLRLAQLPVGAIVLDFDPAVGIVADGAGRVAQWMDRTGGVTLAQATDAAKPVWAANGWASGLPSVSGDGVDDILTGPNPAVDHGWFFHVAERGPSNTASTPTARDLFEFGRSGDGLAIALGGQRPGSDAAQTALRVNSPGSATNFQNRTPWGVGQRSILVQSLVSGSGGQALAMDGAAGMGAFATTPGTTTKTTTSLFGSTTGPNQRQGAKYARLLAVDYDKLPGKREQQYNRFLIEGALARTYGLDKTAWPATHPFKTRDPMPSDFTGNNRLIQVWGNSISNYIFGFLETAFSYSRLDSGLTHTNASAPGTTETAIHNQFVNGYDTGSGVTSGLGIADQRKKITLFLERVQNGVDNPVNSSADFASMKADLRADVAAVEAAQGMSAGQGHIGIMQGWISWNNFSVVGGASRSFIDDYNHWLNTTFPNYVIRTSDFTRSLAAPGLPYADAIYYARSQPPIALNRNGDLIHPSDTLSQLLAQFITAWVEAKGWDK